MIRRAPGLALIAACATAPIAGSVKEAPVRGKPVIAASAAAEPGIAAAAPAAPTVQERLAARGVHHDDHARSVLYTWTTPPQIAALRASRRLLVAEAKAGAGPSPYLRGLERAVRTQAAGHAIAALLLEHPGLRRRRYAWTSPFATTMGLGPLRYGDALVRVDLDPQAVIVRFRPADVEPFTAVDMRGAAVAIADLIADPGRIAAVYHVRDGPDDEIPFREYVLCNESRVAAWSIATPEIRAQVDADIALLEQLRAGPLAWLPAPAVAMSATGAWPTRRPDESALERWHASLAFDNHRYRPSPRNLAAIATALRGYDGRGEPLVHRPAATFPEHDARVSR